MLLPGLLALVWFTRSVAAMPPTAAELCARRGYAPMGVELATLVRRGLQVATAPRPLIVDFVFPPPYATRLADFQSAGASARNEMLKAQLENALTTGLGVVPPERLEEFRELVRQFFQNGGTFLIERDSSLSASRAFFSAENGKLQIAFSDLWLLAAKGDPGQFSREQMMRSLVHELRHYVTHRRQVQARTRKEIGDPAGFLERLKDRDPLAFALYVEQMEREAKAAEDKFVPRREEPRTLDVYYPAMEGMRRRIKALPPAAGKELAETAAQDTGMRNQSDSLAAAVVERYRSAAQAPKLSAALVKELQGYLKAKQVESRHPTEPEKDFAFQYLLSTNILPDAFGPVAGRLTPAEEAALRPLVSARIALKKREIEAAIATVLGKHPEIKPAAEK